jgi:hypothetical protein
MILYCFTTSKTKTLADFLLGDQNGMEMVHTSRPKNPGYLIVTWDTKNRFLQMHWRATWPKSARFNERIVANVPFSKFRTAADIRPAFINRFREYALNS